MERGPLVPRVAVIVEARLETPEAKAFRALTPEGEKLFEHIPGQHAVLSVPGVGEAMISIASSPTQSYFTELSVKKCGALASWLHGVKPGDQVAVRGPFGNGFPVDAELRGKDLLFVADASCMEPLRSAISYACAKKERYGKAQVVCGARSMACLAAYKEVIRDWKEAAGVETFLTIESNEEGWDGHVGFIPNYIEELNPDSSKIVLMCGPPTMIKLAIAALKRLGFGERQVYMTLEMRMKCGIGKCGRCNIGGKHVCKDGPVFRLDELSALPDKH